jgi:hypothetical protein
LPEASTLPYTLVAFSKGGVVLNGMMAELATVLAGQPRSAAAGAEEQQRLVQVEQILDWEAKEVSSHLPSWEPSQRISRYAQHAIHRPDRRVPVCVACYGYSGSRTYLNSRTIRLRPKAESLLAQSASVLAFFDQVRDVYWLDCHRCGHGDRNGDVS